MTTFLACGGYAGWQGWTDHIKILEQSQVRLLDSNPTRTTRTNGWFIANTPGEETHAGQSSTNAWVEALKAPPAEEVRPDDRKKEPEAWAIERARAQLQWINDAGSYGKMTYLNTRSAYNFLNDDLKNTHLIGLTPAQFASIMREQALYGAREFLKEIQEDPDIRSALIIKDLREAIIYAGLQADGTSMRNGVYDSLGISREQLAEMEADIYFASATSALQKLRESSKKEYSTEYPDFPYRDYSESYEALQQGIINGTKAGRTEEDIYRTLGLTPEQLKEMESPPATTWKWRTPSQHVPK